MIVYVLFITLKHVGVSNAHILAQICSTSEKMGSSKEETSQLLSIQNLTCRQLDAEDGLKIVVLIRMFTFLCLPAQRT